MIIQVGEFYVKFIDNYYLLLINMRNIAYICTEFISHLRKGNRETQA
jgi:hypothetical protein